MSEIPYNKMPIGTCSQCGGPVCVHTNWMAVVPDTPTCARCGAIKVDNYGPVIQTTRSVLGPAVKKTVTTRIVGGTNIRATY